MSNAHMSMLRRPRRLVVPLLAAAALLLASGRAESTTVVPVSDDDLIQQADAIVVATVIGIDSRWRPQPRTIVTDITVDVAEALKGRVRPGPLTIRQAGGRVHGLQLWLDGSPEFVVGERVLLFLRRGRDGAARVVHLYQGKFSIEADPVTADAIAVREPAAGVRVLGRSAPHRRRLDDLRQAIRALRGGAEAPVTTSPATSAADIVESRASFTFLGPVPARWFEPDSGAAVTMYLRAAGEPRTADGGFQAVREGYRAWSVVVGSSFRYADGGFTDAGGFVLDGVSAVAFGDPRGDVDPPVHCSGTLAVGGAWRDDTQTRIVNGQTFSRAVEGEVVFGDGWDGCGFYEVHDRLAEVATHELGHVLGLGHSSDPGATMAGVAHFDGRGASLTDDDRAGVSFIYPGRVATLQVVKTGTGAGGVTSSPAGIACGADCIERYQAGADVTLAATAAAGSTFTGWSGGGCAGTGPCRVTVNADTTVTATFAAGLGLSFASPANGTTVGGTTTVTLAARGGSGGYTYRVAVDGTSVYAGTAPSFALDTRTLANGRHTLTGTVSDAAGRTASATLTVTVANAAPPPAGLGVFITSPPAGATLKGTAWVTVWVEGAAAGTNTFSLSIAGTTVGTTGLAASHATIAWDTTRTPNGGQILTATVTDSRGARGQTTRAVVIGNGGASPGGPAPLAAAITSPRPGTTVSGVTAVAMSATGASGAVTFRLSVDGAQVFSQTGAGTTATYTWTTAAVANGGHTLALTASDGAGRTASATATVTVANATTTPPPPPGTVKAELTSPLAGATVKGTAWVTVWIEGAAPGTNTFTLSVGGVVIGTRTLAGTHVSIPWDTTRTGNGRRTIEVTVTDSARRSGRTTRDVTVAN